MKELFYTKTKKGYRCSDRNGHTAEGATKEMARNMWFLQYDFNLPTDIGYDMKQFNNSYKETE